MEISQVDPPDDRTTHPSSPPTQSRPVQRRMRTSDLRFMRFLGEGTNGQVCLATDRISRTRVAVKAVFKRGKLSKQGAVVMRERDIHVKLADSPWFVKMFASWHDTEQFYIAMVGLALISFSFGGMTVGLPSFLFLIGGLSDRP